MTALWIILFIIGIPIVVVFWIAVALIIAIVYDNKKSSKQHLVPLSSTLGRRTVKGRRRNSKTTIVKLR